MHLSSWLLAIPYMIAGIAFAGLAWAIGGLGFRLKSRAMQVCGIDEAPKRSERCRGIMQLIVRLAFGLAVISWIGAVAGVAGYFRWETVWPAIILATVCALVLSIRGRGTAANFKLNHVQVWWRSWRTMALAERSLTGAVILACLLLSANALIGSMVPDMNQDPMWYHLSVPQQWVFDGQYGVYPSVMPSAYPLSVESIFAVIFLLKTDPVLCSILTAICAIALFVGMTAAGVMASNRARARHNTWGAVFAVAGVWVPIIAMFGMLAPLQPKNDIIVMFWTFCGAMILWMPLMQSRMPSLSDCCVVGFLLGTACSGKPSVMVIAAIVLLFGFALALDSVRHGKGDGSKLLRAAVGCIIALILAMLPWMIRGYQSHGLPLFPLGQNLFAIQPEYQPLMSTFDAIHGQNADLSGGMMSAFTQFPGRLLTALQRNENALFAYLVITIGGLVAARGRWRWYALMLLAQVGLIVLVRDRVVYRLMAPAYTLAAPLLAYGVARGQDKLRRPVRLIAAVLIAGLAWAIVVDRQIRISKFHTYTWRFHPVLSQADTDAYAQFTEIGSSYLRFARFRQIIPKDARVLVLGSFYPFYLHRDTIWNDEAVKACGVTDRWKHFTADEAARFIAKQDVDYVLMADDPSAVRVADECVTSGAIEPVALPEKTADTGWKLYRVGDSQTDR